MPPTSCTCPDCKKPLTLRNSGDYYCVFCRQFFDGQLIDPLGHDDERNKLVIDMALERAGIL